MSTFYEHVTVEENGIATIVRFREAAILDQLAIQQISEEFSSIVESRPCLNLVVNFQGVKFLSSSMLSKLFSLRRGIEAAKGKLRLAAVSPEILEVFRITQLDREFDIKKDVAEALEGF